MNHSNCGPNCSYRRLYEGVQGSLADMAANHASQAKRTRRLRDGLISVLRATAPKRFGAIERHMEMRLSEVDDETLLAAAQAIMEPVRDEKALSDLRVALSEAGFGWAASTSPADLIDTVRRNPVASSYSNPGTPSSQTPISDGFSLPPGVLPSMLPGVSAAKILEAKRAGRLQDLLKDAYREYARANGLPEDPKPAPEVTSAPSSPAPTEETREYVDPNLDNLFTEENKTVEDSEEDTPAKRSSGGRPTKTRKKSRAQAVDPAESLAARALDDTPEGTQEETSPPVEDLDLEVGQPAEDEQVSSGTDEEVQPVADAAPSDDAAPQEEIDYQDFASMFDEPEESAKESFDLSSENFSDDFGSDSSEDIGGLDDFEDLDEPVHEAPTDSTRLESAVSEETPAELAAETQDEPEEPEEPAETLESSEDSAPIAPAEIPETDLSVEEVLEEETETVGVAEVEEDTQEEDLPSEAEASEDQGVASEEKPAEEPQEEKQEQLPIPPAPAARNVRSPSSVYQFSQRPPRREPTAPISKELKEARRRAISPDTPEAAASAEVDADTAATFEAYVTLDRPAFVSDLADITGDASIVDAWVDAIRDEDEPRFKALAPKKRYNSRGALIIPVGSSRSLMEGNSDTTWLSVLDRFQGAALIETAVFLHDFRDEVQTWKYTPNNHAVFTRLSSNGQMTGVVLAYGDDFSEDEVRTEIAEMVEEAFGDRLSMVAILAVSGPAFDSLSTMLTKTAKERNWNPASTVVVGRAYEWLSGGGGMVQLF